MFRPLQDCEAEEKMNLSNQKELGEEERNRQATQTVYQLTFGEADTEVWKDIQGVDVDNDNLQLE